MIFKTKLLSFVISLIAASSCVMCAYASCSDYLSNSDNQFYQCVSKSKSLAKNAANTLQGYGENNYCSTVDIKNCSQTLATRIYISQYFANLKKVSQAPLGSSAHENALNTSSTGSNPMMAQSAPTPVHQSRSEPPQQSTLLTPEVAPPPQTITPKKSDNDKSPSINWF